MPDGWLWPSGSGAVLAELEAAGLVTLANKGYKGSTYAKIPYKGGNKPESQTWRILRKLRWCPWHAVQLATAIHVLQIREAYAGWKRLTSLFC